MRRVCGVWCTEFLDLCCRRIFYRAGSRPNTLFVLKTGIGHGVKKGYLATTGVFIGDAVLMFLAQAGVAALIEPLRYYLILSAILGRFICCGSAEKCSGPL